MSKTKRVIGTGGLAMLLGLAACGGSDGAGATQTGALCTALPPLPLKDTYRVGFAQVYEDNGPWRNANTMSMMDEAAKRGYQLVYHAGTTPDAYEQVERMQELIDAKVDGAGKTVPTLADLLNEALGAVQE